MDVSSGDYYRRLRVPRTASCQDIKTAFRRLARQYHPDLHPNQPGTAANFLAITEAYEVLTDPVRRRHYDHQLARTNYRTDSFIGSGEAYVRNRNPKTAADFYIRGVRSAIARRYSAAIKDYAKAIALDPKFSEAYLRRAEVCYTLGDDSKVLADCQQAIALNPTEARTYHYQGMARYRLGYVQSAIAAFTDAIRCDANDARYHELRGIAYQDLHDIEDAAKDLRHAAQIYRDQGNIAKYRETQQTLKELGTAGQTALQKLASRCFRYTLKPLLRPFLSVFKKKQNAQTEAHTERSPSTDESATPPNPNRSNPNRSNPNRSNRPHHNDADTRSQPKSPRARRPRDPSTASGFPTEPFHRPKKGRKKGFGESRRDGFFRPKTYWAPGVSSRPTSAAPLQNASTAGLLNLLRLLSNPAGEMVFFYNQLPVRRRAIVGYGLAVLANLCFVFGITQYLDNSTWQIASVLWISGGLTFVSMVFALSVIRLCLRMYGSWAADIFILGTTLIPFGLLAIVGSLIPLLSELLVAPWDRILFQVGFLMSALWSLSHASIALNSGLSQIHVFSEKTAAWLTPLILGLGISTGIVTWLFI